MIARAMVTATMVLAIAIQAGTELGAPLGRALMTAQTSATATTGRASAMLGTPVLIAL